MNEVFKILAQNVILNPEWYYFAKESGIDFELFPDKRMRENLLEFDSLVREKNFDFASHMKVEFASEIGMELSSYAPTDKRTVIDLYKNLTQTYYAKELARKILADPLMVHNHIADFKNKIPDSDEMYELRKDVFELYPKIIENAESDEPFRTINDWESFSTAVGGFNDERVGILVARSGFGKTTLAINLALKASQKNASAYFNMEMSRLDFFEKALMAAAKMSYREIKFFPKENEFKVAEFITNFSKAKNFYYSDGKAQSLDKIESFLRSKRGEIKFAIVDYDQKIAVSTSRETPEWKALQLAVERLEQLAKEYKCFILLLAQESNGDVGASKRSKNPATFVARFFSEEINQEQRFFIQMIKNRFGPTDCAIEVNYIPEMSKISEIKKIYQATEFQKLKDEDVSTPAKNPFGKL